MGWRRWSALSLLASVVLALGAEQGGAASPGPVAAYGFNEGSGPTVADATGNGNGGTISGATWSTAGRFGNALSFDGTNDWVTVADANSLDLSNGMTLEAWVYPTSLTNWRQVILKERTGGLEYAMYANMSANRPSAHVWLGSDMSVRGTAKLASNAWTHLAATYDGATLRLYVNGAEVSSGPVTGSMAPATGPLRFGGNSIWAHEFYRGRIDEIRIYNRALSAAEILADRDTPVGSTPPPPGDMTPPSVSMTAPADGATVSETTTVSANASDNVGVAGVQFKLDGANLGAEDTSSPYEISWDTTTAPNGPHSLTAVARDPSTNHSTATAVNVTVDNPELEQVGRWEGPFAWPLVPVHMILQPTGRVLVFDGFGAATNSERLWDPASGTFTAVPYGRNLFCSGHVKLADGRTIVFGGHISAYNGLSDTTIFDPTTNTWSRRADMSAPRWYPTASTLPDGRVLLMSGDNVTRTELPGIPARLIYSSNTLVEIYDPAANSYTELPAANRVMPLYPFLFVLPDGRVFDAGPDTQTRALDTSTGQWTSVATSHIDGHSAVMYRPGKVLKSGTWADPEFDNLAVTDRAEVIDMNLASPSWREVDPMESRRSYHTLTVLPDGNVLATGGGTASDGTTLSNAVFDAEIWDAETENWTRMAAMQTPRLYHSSALLLPDARVLVAGGGRVSGATNQFSAEIYSPPYLFKGSRPTIGSAPATAQYGTNFQVTTPDAARIQSVALIRTSSVTHNNDMDQRYVPLTFRRVGADLEIDAPANPNLAPPGTHMLFLVDSAGVPSVASFVRLPISASDAQPPTVPGSLTATGSLTSAALTWNASSDNVGVTRYNVHRSNTSGFLPSDANRVTQVTGTSYTDSGLPAGVYFYLVTAEDDAGNVSLPSNEAIASVGDTTPPTVNITAPSDGATVSATVTVSADASDDVGVAGVQFKLNGANLGAEDMTSPYSIPWDTTTTSNGAKQLTAIVSDGGGNTTTSVVVNVTVSNAAPPPAPGLVAAYSFNAGTGTTAADASGTGNPGSLSGATWTTAGRFGNALSFDGVDDWVTIADAASLDLTTGMTLMAWVNPLSLSSWRQVLLKERTSHLSYALYANSSTNTPSGHVYISGDRSVRGTSQVPLNVWTHLATTYDGATQRFYVNGTQVASRAQTGSIAVGTGPLRIGGNAVWPVEWFNGRIDEVRVYNRALSAAEINTDMNNGIGGG